MRNFLLVTLFFALGQSVFSQYAPAAGVAGSSAVNKNDVRIKYWASHCSIYRGYLDIANKNDGFATVGDSTSALGVSGVNGIVSLGDSGVAILSFEHPIKNGAGYDFAIFENSFSDSFLEFAFVEVSSNGIDFYRFAAHSLVQATVQTNPYGFTQPTKVNNLAGKYKATYGTPFDLEELKDSTNLDVNRITHVKIIDVVGSINPKYGQMDTAGNYINDPYPTPFPSSGFDLDAVAVLNSDFTGLNGVEKSVFNIFPNPVLKGNKIHIAFDEPLISLELLDFNGRLIEILELAGQIMPTDNLTKGNYLLKLQNIKGIYYQKLRVE